MALSALEQLRAEQPYWNASGGADHEVSPLSRLRVRASYPYP